MYKPEFPNLCSHLHIGNVTLRNRMCSAPMGFPDLTEDGCLTDGAIASLPRAVASRDPTNMIHSTV